MVSLPATFTMPPLVPGKAPADTTVVVAMSGGVDSSAVAALCHAAGYKTIGMTLQLWDYTPASNGGTIKAGGTCCALDDVYDARRVCQTLGIPHYVLNMESAFKEAVIDDFVETYLSGATPIPCVRCNQRIKFKELLDRAKTLGADVLVTGHYVQKQIIDGKAVLTMGADPKKDQSYYLFTTTQEQLDWLHFPLGHITKDVTRQLAKDLGLHVHHKKDSYDICFVPGGDYRKVVKKFAPEAEKPGNIVDSSGHVIGTHDGIVGFTVGQRKGVGGGFAEPMFVTEIRPHTNEVVIGPRSQLGRREFYLKDMNWLGDNIPIDDEPGLPRRSEAKAGLPILIKVRSQHTPAPGHAWLMPSETGPGMVRVVLDNPEEQVSPGQAGVCYSPDGIMYGGGWITLFPTANLSLNQAATPLSTSGKIKIDITHIPA